jgi:hypothetical protein
MPALLECVSPRAADRAMSCSRQKVAISLPCKPRGRLVARVSSRAVTADLIAEYRRRGWSLVPIPAGCKSPRIACWETREFAPADFC